MCKMFLAVLLFAVNPMVQAQTEMPKPAYDFPWPREERIQLVGSAAPVEISLQARVFLLEHTGYGRVASGTSGFSGCETVAGIKQRGSSKHTVTEGNARGLESERDALRWLGNLIRDRGIHEENSFFGRILFDVRFSVLGTEITRDGGSK